MKKFIIGVDYGCKNDKSMFTVLKKEGEQFQLVDCGFVEEFDYSKYVASTHQVIGEGSDLEKFKQQFLK